MHSGGTLMSAKVRESVCSSTSLDLNGSVLASGLSVGTRKLGDGSLRAETRNGILTGRMDANAANKRFTERARCAWRKLSNGREGDFFRSGRCGLASAMGAAANNPDFTGVAAGQLSVSGPIRTPDLLTANLEITQLELSPSSDTTEAKTVPGLVLRNKGPIRLALVKSVFQVQSSHLEGPGTDIDVKRAIALRGESPLNLQLEGKINLHWRKASTAT